MSAGASEAPAPREEVPMLKRLQAAVEESVPGGGVRVYAEGSRYVLRGGPPRYRELDSRPCKLVLEWRNPESTMAHVARGVARRARLGKDAG